MGAYRRCLAVMAVLSVFAGYGALRPVEALEGEQIQRALCRALENGHPREIPVYDSDLFLFDGELKTAVYVIQDDIEPAEGPLTI